MTTRKAKTTSKKTPPRKPGKTAKPGPPAPGPGRPRKPRPPRDEKQVGLKAAVDAAEDEHELAFAAYGADTSVAAEIRLYRAQISVASAWAAYLRAQGNHTHALQHTTALTKLAGRVVQLREIVAADQLEQLLKRAGREDALRDNRQARARGTSG